MTTASSPTRTPGTAAGPGPAAGPVDSAVLISRALEVAGRLANDAAEVITATAGPRPSRDRAAEAPASPYDWVTDTDRTLERHTRRVLSAEFPGVPVLGEEYGGPDGEHIVLPDEPGAAPLLWVVDPIDGTANYAVGLPWSAFSLALLDARGPLVGVIADPYQAQIYAGARGRGLRANGRVIAPFGAPADPDRTAGAPAEPALAPLRGALICTEATPAWRGGGRVGGDHQPHERIDLAALVTGCRDAGAGLRVLGSAALAITQVLLGRAAAAVLTDYRVWDVAGALALAAEAGAEITDLAGTPSPLPLDGLVVADPRLGDAVRALLVPAA